MNFNVNTAEVAGIAGFTTLATHLVSKVTATFGPWVVSSRLSLMVGSVAATVAIVTNNLFTSGKHTIQASHQAAALVGSSLAGTIAGLTTWNFFSATATPNLFAAKTVVLFTTLIAFGQLGAAAFAEAAKTAKARQAQAI